jgi:hypothetical protein
MSLGLVFSPDRDHGRVSAFESLIAFRFTGPAKKRLLLFSKGLSRAPFFGKAVLRRSLACCLGTKARKEGRVTFGRAIADYPGGSAVNFNPVLEEQRG